MQNCFLQSTFADIVVDGSARLAQEQRQGFPVPEHIQNGFAQSGVWLYLAFIELLVTPTVQVLHKRGAALLMKAEALNGSKLLLSCQRVIMKDILQRIARFLVDCQKLRLMMRVPAFRYSS